MRSYIAYDLLVQMPASIEMSVNDDDLTNAATKTATLLICPCLDCTTVTSSLNRCSDSNYTTNFADFTTKATGDTHRWLNCWLVRNSHQIQYGD